MQSVMKRIYELIMIVLVMITIITLWTENTYNSTINWVVWFVFFADFIIRFIASKEKWNFIKKNPFLVIAVIPLGQFFQIARVVRIIYLFRIKTITKYYFTPYVEKLTYLSTSLIAFIFTGLLFIEATVILNVESTIPTYFNALYVVLGHLLFFGHQLFEINNSISIWLLTATSIFGVVIQGLALQWAFNKVEKYFSYFKNKKKKNI
ncbi:transporter [Aquibacillus rhizosphaerae]|uniref:Transporter n=1 Tax=Aquibacillus rhizosphaerae TaxID=3051431 RepID=A0ABT7LAP8_9BACI|nr:transporter [Aquibacillus sp. LR5S19]MDL4841626.1 transporter [Aquibacillus sp. LR5S19]